MAPRKWRSRHSRWWQKQMKQSFDHLFLNRVPHFNEARAIDCTPVTILMTRPDLIFRIVCISPFTREIKSMQDLIYTCANVCDRTHQTKRPAIRILSLWCLAFKIEIWYLMDIGIPQILSLKCCISLRKLSSRLDRKVLFVVEHTQGRDIVLSEG